MYSCTLHPFLCVGLRQWTKTGQTRSLRIIAGRPVVICCYTSPSSSSCFFYFLFSICYVELKFIPILILMSSYQTRFLFPFFSLSPSLISHLYFVKCYSFPQLFFRYPFFLLMFILYLLCRFKVYFYLNSHVIRSNSVFIIFFFSPSLVLHLYFVKCYSFPQLCFRYPFNVLRLLPLLFLF